MRFPDRVSIVRGGLGAFAVLLVLRSAQLQLVEGDEWQTMASQMHFREREMPAPRGDITDASGDLLAQSLTRLRVSVAPGELTDSGRSTLSSLLKAAGVPADVRRRALNPRQNWVVLPGRFLSAELPGIERLRGVYTEPVIQRLHLASPGVAALLGNINGSGQAMDGMEQVLDEFLRGRAGSVRILRDVVGRPDMEVPVGQPTPPVKGNSVTLTIDRRLQELAEQALSQAVEDLPAKAGDIVIVSPRTGEVLALAGYSQEDGFRNSSAITAPFEPGSAIKPLLAAQLLEKERVRDDEVIQTFGGKLTVPGRRNPITDEHPADSLTFREILRYSSNVGMAQLARRFTPAEEYETYRDFGLGMPTGIEYSLESAGTLNPPSRWSGISQEQLAIGYEVSVTSLQLAMAFASIANGGELLQPTLVREIRSPDGDLLYRHKRTVVRRNLRPQVAAQMRSILREVVQGGTAVAADLSLGPLAGKTGTARLSDGAAGYIYGKHIATFAGMFPSDDPEYVIVVKLIDPVGSFASVTAAPVTRAVLQAAALTQSGALDNRYAMHSAEQEPDSAIGSRAGPRTDTGARARAASHVVSLDAALAELGQQDEPRAVPKVAGLALRVAVHELHQAGFRVRIEGSAATAAGTTPAAGAVRKPGDTVVLVAGR